MKYKMKCKKLFFKLIVSFLVLLIKNIHSQEMLTAVQMRQSGKKAFLGKSLYKDLGRKFSFFTAGQVAVVGFYDSHQFVGIGEDAVVFYPEPQDIDSSGLDINNKDQFDMFAVNVGIKSLFEGPDLWGAKVIGRFEFGFGGIAEQEIQALGVMSIGSIYMSFLWRRTEVRFGQFFHPLALSKTYPTPVSGDEGLGFDPIRRVPMIRLVHVVDKFKFTLALSKLFGLKEARRAVLPDFFCKLNVRFGRKYHFGVGLNYHAEVPRLETEENYKTTEQVSGIAAFVYARLRPYPFIIKTRFNYIENGSPFGIMGSYSAQYRNFVTDEIIYTPMRAVTFWTDIVYVKNKNIEPGLFLGFAKDLGASKNIVKGYTKIEDGKQEDVSLININSTMKSARYFFRVAPRVRTRVRNLIFGFEVSYARAAFARDSSQEGWQDDYDCHGRVVNAKPASNMRLIFNAVYAF
ncbi:hypothetical protein ACFLYU_00045 [Candidatus Dependentiae bacterium]